MTCQCGCGRETSVAKKTRTHLGHVKGQPVPFCAGHSSLPGPEARFWARVDKTDTCWLWTGKPDPQTGYGTISVLGPKVAVHRFSYELLVGPIPEGLQIDHLCRVRTCVNPAHLEPVTQAENVRRGMSPSAVAARTNTCSKGHHDQWVVYPNSRACRACWKERVEANREANNRRRREWRAARRAAGKVAS